MLDTEELFSDEDDAKAQELLAERLTGLVERLQANADDRVSHRAGVETEWLRDLEAFHSKYDPDTQKKLNIKRRANKSKLYLGKTGEKTRAWISRIQDILFPTDDKNWAIQPTPVPTLSRAADKAVQEVNRLEAQATAEAEAQGNANPATMDALSAANAESERLAQIDEEARDRCDLMQQEMDDQLQEARYNAQSRDDIEQACKLGTGIMEGPVTNERVRRGWKEDEAGNFTLKIGGDPRPAYYHVDCWNFFPSNDAKCVEDSEGFMVRNVWTPKLMRDFAKINGTHTDGIRELLRMGPQSYAPDYMNGIRSVTGETTGSTDRVFIAWKYCGPLAADDMRTLARVVRDKDTLTDLDDIDPLEELQAVVWFCAGKLLKFSIYPYDSGEPMFTRFCFEKDDGSFWGYGVPRLMRDPQKAANAAWRLMMDNSEVSGSPQLFADTSRIQPSDGSASVITGGQVWIPKGDAITQGFNGKELYAVDIPSHQAELANIIELASRMIDDVTMTPQLAQGEQGTGVTETAQGMALLMNAANIMTKRVIKNYDDDKTVPEIRRLYDWNMQFSPRPEIKGDYMVDARGSSVLLVREMQARNLLTLAVMFKDDPMVKQAELKREIFRAHLLPADRFVKTDTEIDKEAANAPEDPMIALEREKIALEVQKIEAQMADTEARTAIAEMETDSKERIAELQHETEMMKLAETMNMKLEDIDARLTDGREKRRSTERGIAAEAAMRASETAPLNETQVANA